MTVTRCSVTQRALRGVASRPKNALQRVGRKQKQKHTQRSSARRRRSPVACDGYSAAFAPPTHTYRANGRAVGLRVSLAEWCRPTRMTSRTASSRCELRARKAIRAGGRTYAQPRISVCSKTGSSLQDTMKDQADLDHVTGTEADKATKAAVRAEIAELTRRLRSKQIELESLTRYDDLLNAKEPNDAR